MPTLIMSLLQYPDPFLEKRCDKITQSNLPQDFEARIDLMRKIMKQKIGAGIAAPQMGWNARVFVISGDVFGSSDRVFVNPEIHFPKEDNEEVEGLEGCLSLPKVSGVVKRWKRVVAVTHDATVGADEEEEFEGMAARVIQHELDHLNGILFYHRMSEEAQRQLERTLRKLRNKYERMST